MSNNINMAKADNSIGFSQGINYTGKINISLQHKNGRIEKIYSHNEGTETLFKFIAYCLSGQYSNAEALRPKYIKLFNKSSSTSEIVETDISDYTYLNNVDITSQTSADITTWQAVLHFTIPVSSLFSQSANLNLVRLYGDGENKIAEATIASEVSLNALSRNTNLIIEWIMSTSNVKKETK